MMRSIWSFSVLAAAAIALGAVAPVAAQQRYGVDSEGNRTDWKEENTVLPAFPVQANLREFPALSGASTIQYFLDIKSLSLGDDDVVRYTVVIVPRGGAVNVFHEGAYCDTNEFKRYAYGTASGTFQRASSGRWRIARSSGVMSYQYVLIRRYLCSLYGVPMAPEAVVERLEDPNYDEASVDGNENNDGKL